MKRDTESVSVLDAACQHMEDLHPPVPWPLACDSRGAVVPVLFLRELAWPAALVFRALFDGRERHSTSALTQRTHFGPLVARLHLNFWE
jgi:hypothetical protein